MAWCSALGTFRFASGRGQSTRFGAIWRSSGLWLPGGPAHVGQLAREAGVAGSELPEGVRGACEVLLRMIDMDSGEIAEIEQEMRAQAAAETARLMSIPGIGPVGAMAFQAFAPPLEGFRRGRDCAAWLGPVPRQHGTGGKTRLGRVSKMDRRDLRRLLVSGAMTAIRRAAQLRQGPLAHAHVGAQAQDARRRRACQPHGADGVGGGDEEGVGPRSGGGRRRGGQSRDGVGGAGKPEERVRANGH